MASGLRPAAVSGRVASRSISSIRCERISPSVTPSRRRISSNSRSASSNASAAAAFAALSSASSLSGSTTSITPLIASSPSILGATASILPARTPATFTIDASTSSLIRTVETEPVRLTLRLAYTVPLESTSPARFFANASRSSQPGGRRVRRSNPLALTDFNSHSNAYGPLVPWLRAKPVMLDSAIAWISPAVRGVGLARKALRTLARIPQKWIPICQHVGAGRQETLAAVRPGLALDHRRPHCRLCRTLPRRRARGLLRRRPGRGSCRAAVDGHARRGRWRLVGRLNGVVLDLLFHRTQLGDVL